MKKNNNTETIITALKWLMAKHEKKEMSMKQDLVKDKKTKC